VSDTGRGISKEKRQEIFKFLNTENINSIEDNNDAVPATTSLAGMGLGISQKIAQKLGSNIEFSSTIDIGSTFWFSINITDEFIPNEDAKPSNTYNELVKDIQNSESEIIKSSREPKKRKYTTSKNATFQISQDDFRFNMIKGNDQNNQYVQIHYDYGK